MTPEEALRHAYAADVGRMPAPLRQMYPVDRLVQDHLAGRRNKRFFEELQLGDPDYVAQSEDERTRQDALLSGYSGMPWTPEQRKALGREPQPYEFSPGARMRDAIKSRQSLYDSIAPVEPKPKGWLDSLFGDDAFGGPPAEGSAVGMSPLSAFSRGQKHMTPEQKAYQRAASNYSDNLGRTHAYLAGLPGVPDEGLMMLANPENFVGTFATKAGPVLSDTASQFATALLRGKESGESVTESLGNAAVRARGADWNRTSPQLAFEPANWRDADDLVNTNRAAWQYSQGMSAGDTSRAVLEPMGLTDQYGRVPYAQPAINALLSFGNGALDGTGATMAATKTPAAVARIAAKGAVRSGVPGVSHFGKSMLSEMDNFAKQAPTIGSRASYALKDEAFDPGTLAGAAFEFMAPPEHLTRDEWGQHMKTMDDARKASIRQLESSDDLIKRPEPYGIEGALRKGYRGLKSLVE